MLSTAIASSLAKPAGQHAAQGAEEPYRQPPKLRTAAQNQGHSCQLFRPRLEEKRERERKKKKKKGKKHPRGVWFKKQLLHLHGCVWGGVFGACSASRDGSKRVSVGFNE